MVFKKIKVIWEGTLKKEKTRLGKTLRIKQYKKDGNRTVFDYVYQLGTKTRHSNMKTVQNYKKRWVLAKFNSIT